LGVLEVSGEKEAAMEVRAVARNVPMSTRKVRLVVDLVRGRPVEEALAILQFTPKAAAVPVAKVVASAAANAENNYSLNRRDLVVASIAADEARPLKRGRARARGHYDRIVKRASHVTVVVSDT
jgi:large subunit ribosomal protein L22